MTIEDTIRHHLAVLYGLPAAEAAWNKLARILEQYRRHPAPVPAHAGPFSEKDAVLITYGDTFNQPGRAPLETLGEFTQTWLGEAVSGIHILPFYPSSSDDGFSVIDYRQVAPELGSWKDIARLGKRYRLMFDGVINHISQSSVWFQACLRGEAPYRDYFIRPGGDWELTQVVRPRTLPLLTQYDTADGPQSIWTTFSADQVDLNYANPQVLLEVIELLLLYVERGATIIRLDAIAYLWKEPGTSCINLPQTHRVIKILRLALDLVAPHVTLITETNVPHAENISYFGELNPDTGRTDEAQLVYQFSLAPLALHSFLSGDASCLSQWADKLESPGLFFNFIASHDGIGLQPARDLLKATDIQRLVDQTLAHGGQVSWKSNPDGSQSSYELNITLFDALNDPGNPNPILDQARFLASQVIMLSLAGVPGIYVHSLFGSRNCLQCVEETGRARSINREKFDYPLLQADLKQGKSQAARILGAYRRLLTTRSQLPAFHPSGVQKVLFLDPAVFALLRMAPDGSRPVLCLVNVAPETRSLQIDLKSAGLPVDRDWVDCIGEEHHRASAVLNINLAPYQVSWLAPEP